MENKYDEIFKSAKTHGEARLIFHSNVTKEMNAEQKDMLFDAYKRAKKRLPDEELELIRMGMLS